MFSKIMSWVFGPVTIAEYHTVDGGNLAPYPDMTDLELYEFERDMNVPNPTFKEPPPEDYWADLD